MTARRDPRPLYARLLRLRRLRPGSLMCFLLFEGSILLAILLSMAELVSWWSVPVLPLVVAAMVKINDLVAGTRPAGPRATGLVRVDGDPQLQEAQTVPGLSGSGAPEGRRAARHAADHPDLWGEPAEPTRRAAPEPENVRFARRTDARRFD